MLAIRTDANEIIATGHIMRCITIAVQLKKRGEEVLFITADEYPVPMLKRAGMKQVCLYTDYKKMEEEIPALLRELKNAGCDKVLVDSYQVTKVYLEALKSAGKTVIYIDDMFEDIYPVDMLINYNAYYVRFPYMETYKEKTELLLGTAYVPLREEFSKARLSPAKDRHVLLSCGGGDVYNVLAGILREASGREGFDSVIFDTIVGHFNKNSGELEELAQKSTNIRLHYDVKAMAELMAQCELAVSAAGTMLFELCSMQLPTVFFVCADNQKYDSEFFAAEERMLFAGDIRTDREDCVQRICGGLERLLKDGGLRDRMKASLHEVTDGKGAERIAEEIIRLKQ